jgi:hypothetical protein
LLRDEVAHGFVRLVDVVERPNLSPAHRPSVLESRERA